MQATRLLVPVDFSRDSRYALGQADRIASRNEGRITLLHVHPLVQAVFMDATYFESPEHLVPALERLEDRLETWAGDVKTPRENVVCRVVLGVPADEIIAETSNHDLVVIAPQGRGGLTHFLMGSVAERVVRGSACSVLVVKRESRKQLE